MKLKVQALLDHCISEGLSATVSGCDVDITTAQMQAIMDRVSDEIWLQLDTYFDFE